MAKRDHAKKMKEMREWNDDELRMLDKAVKKFPMGTPKRWEQVTSAHIQLSGKTRAKTRAMLCHLAWGDAAVRATCLFWSGCLFAPRPLPANLVVLGERTGWCTGDCQQAPGSAVRLRTRTPCAV